MNKISITMFCIIDLTEKEYKMYNPYYDAWHAPLILDGSMESSSLMKSTIEAVHTLKKLYLAEDQNYRKKIDAQEIVIKEINLMYCGLNIENCQTYELLSNNCLWSKEPDDTVNFIEFSGNALNYISRNNPEYFKANWEMDFEINKILKKGNYD